MASKAEKPYRSVPYSQILRLLEELNSSKRGQAVFRHISETFDHLETSRLETESQYIEVLDLLFSTLAANIDNDSPLQTEIHILKSTLVPSMPSYELTHLKVKTRNLAQHINPIDVQPSSGEAVQTATHAGKVLTPTQDEHPVPNQTESTKHKTARAQYPAFNYHLNETRNSIQRIKNKLHDQLDSATGHNKDLARLLKESMEAVRLIDSKEHIDKMRLNYMRRYIQLFKEHQDLATRFDDIRTRLNDIESNSQFLDDELTRVHLLSFTDELTQLPNRRAFKQRLDDEVTRTQRYGGSLALSIIDMDEFKPINDKFGHDVGDAVLRHFANTALAVFRHHDTVARYGGEEFAILMPNTEQEGAMCALRKIQAELSNSSCKVDSNRKLENPTFSAGIALYNKGESTDSLIKRADSAMYRAKHSGKNRIEVHDDESSDISQTETSSA
ncbi:GGDEF domain-containing protein [Pseudomonadota bacterium]